ncbi:hypothetical protein GC163_22920 [bacterium]|nr:hypothetical protein [bacterium]
MYSRKIENVQDLVKAGLWVFPVHSLENGQCTCGNLECKDVAKHPLTQQGCKDATQDAQSLAQYFTGDYAIANIGVATGASRVIGLWMSTTSLPSPHWKRYMVRFRSRSPHEPAAEASTTTSVVLKV